MLKVSLYGDRAHNAREREILVFIVDFYTFCYIFSSAKSGTCPPANSINTLAPLGDRRSPFAPFSSRDDFKTVKTKIKLSFQRSEYVRAHISINSKDGS